MLLPPSRMSGSATDTVHYLNTIGYMHVALPQLDALAFLFTMQKNIIGVLLAYNHNESN